jgi:hypothetical protein
MFLAALPNRVNDRAGNTAFRKGIIAQCMEDFGITLASAATHYNHAFINAKELGKTDAALAGLLEGLGRPEDKKGGRKPKVKAEVAADDMTVADVLGSNLLNNGDEMTGAEEPAAAPAADVAPAEPVVKYSVRKASDGTVVCEDLTLEEANALIEKAAKAKKAKLELVA